MKTFLSGNDRLGKLLLMMMFAAALLLRTSHISGALEYDEIWSLENFSQLPVNEIFTRLSLPNNQVLNSLWIKTAAALSLPLTAIRLHSLAAGMLSILLAGFLAFVLSGRKRSAGIAAMLLLTFSAPDAVYAQLARGYSLQVFFLALFSAGLAMDEEKIPGKAAIAAVFFGALGAVFTLPTSAMYLALIAAGAVIIRKRLPSVPMLITLAAAGGISLLYMALNYSELNAARVWGTKITSVQAFFRFCGTTLRAYLAGAAGAFSLYALFKMPGKVLPLAGIILFSLLTALLTNAGPLRAYIPFALLLAVSGGCGAALLEEKIPQRFKKAALVLLIVLLAGLYCRDFRQWHTPDWQEVFDACRNETQKVLVVHRATSGYPLLWNCGEEIVADLQGRMLSPESSRELLIFDLPGRLNGNDKNNCEVSLPLLPAGRSENVCGLDAVRYTMTRTLHPADGKAALVILPPMEKASFTMLYDMLNGAFPDLTSLNPWLTGGVASKSAGACGIYGFRPPEKNTFDWETFINASGGRALIYQIN